MVTLQLSATVQVKLKTQQSLTLLLQQIQAKLKLVQQAVLTVWLSTTNFSVSKKNSVMLLTIQVKSIDFVNNIKTLYYYNSHFENRSFLGGFFV